MTKASPLRVLQAALRRYQTPIRVLALLLAFTAVTSVLFLSFRGTTAEVGALTDAAATSIAVESEVINFMTEDSQGNVSDRVLAQMNGTTTEPVRCGNLGYATGGYSGSPRRGVSVSGGARIYNADSPLPSQCGGISVGGFSYSVTWREWPSGRTYSTSRRGGCSSSGLSYSCSAGSAGPPAATDSRHYWYISRWSISCPRVSYGGRTVRVSCVPPRPPKPPPTPTPLADPISATLEITSSPDAHDTYAIGEEIEVKVAFSEDVTTATTSRPSLRLSLDSGRKTASYNRSSGNRDIYFTYTVAEGDLDPTGLAVPENPMGGHVYVGVEKRRLVNSGLQSDTDHQVDGVRPRINRVEIDRSAFNDLKPADTGYDIDLLVSFDEDVEVTGDPQIVLKVNRQNATSTFAEPTGHTLSKVFRYLLPKSSDSAETSTTTRVSLPAGEVSLDSDDAVKDLAGNDAILTYRALREFTMTSFDNEGPVLEGLSISGETNRYGWLRICKEQRLGGHFRGCEGLTHAESGRGYADITAQFDEALKLNAPRTVTRLEVTLAGGATSTTEIPFTLQALDRDVAMGKIVFKYYVKVGEYAEGGLSLEPGELRCTTENLDCYDDIHGNDAESLAHTGLPLQPQYRIDGVSPTISGLEMLSEAPGREGWYGIGDTIRVGMRFSEPVLVGSYGPLNGTTTSTFIPNSGGNLKLPLTLDPATTSPTELVRRSGDIMAEVHDFRFVVREGDSDPTGISVAANSLIRTQIGTSTATTTNNRKAVIHDIAYNHLCEGGISNWQIYNPKDELDPHYDMDNQDRQQFEECDGGQDQHPALAAQTDHKVDGTRPTLESVEFANTPADNDGYAIGEAIEVTATFSERVWVYGSPIVNLTLGDSMKQMTYYPLTTTNASGTLEYIATDSLTFVYIVEEGDEDTDGLSIPANAFNKMGALIDDVARNEVMDISHDAVDTDSSRKVDGIRATITGRRFISSPSPTSTTTDTYTQGDEIAVELTFSEPVSTVPDGALMDMELTLADSSTTTRRMRADGVTSTTTVVFRYTVTGQDLGTDMKIPADPFGTPISDLINQVTATTTLIDLLGTSLAALNLVDRVSFVDNISIGNRIAARNRRNRYPKSRGNASAFSRRTKARLDNIRSFPTTVNCKDSGTWGSLSRNRCPIQGTRC